MPTFLAHISAAPLLSPVKMIVSMIISVILPSRLSSLVSSSFRFQNTPSLPLMPTQTTVAPISVSHRLAVSYNFKSDNVHPLLSANFSFPSSTKCYQPSPDADTVDLFVIRHHALPRRDANGRASVLLNRQRQWVRRFRLHRAHPA